MDCTFDVLRSRRHELRWVTHTRPDVAWDSVLLDKFTKESFQPVHIKQLNTTIRRVKAEPELRLKKHKLDLQSLMILAFADSSFSNATNYHKQLGSPSFWPTRRTESTGYTIALTGVTESLG